jgi:hypothetical protein
MKTVKELMLEVQMVLSGAGIQIIELLSEIQVYRRSPSFDTNIRRFMLIAALFFFHSFRLFLVIFGIATQPKVDYLFIFRLFETF